MAARYRFELIPRAYSVGIYDEAHPVNYIASCQITKYGDVGLMYSMTGAGFYKAFSEPGSVQKLMDEAGVSSFEGYVMPSHARLLKAALRESGSVEIVRTGKMAGREMVWVVVRAI